MFSVINIDIEFSFYDVVNKNASFDTYLIIFRVPVSLVGDWYSFPSVMIHVSKSLTDNSDDSFGENMRL